MKILSMNPGKLWAIAKNAAIWHAKYYLTGHGFPLVCGVFLTNRCNLRCRMCSIWTDRKKSDLSFEQVKNVIDTCSPGLCYLSFSGGEPLLVDGIMDMIAYAAKKIPYVHLVSNGILLTRSAAMALASTGLSEVSLSLDGEKQWHNAVRNSDKSFDAVMTALENMNRHAPRINVVINSVMFPENPEQVLKAAAIARELGVMCKVQPVNAHFEFNDQSSSPRSVRFESSDPQAISSTVKALLKLPHVVNSRVYLKSIPSYFSQRLTCPMTRRGCVLPQYFLEVSSYGMASPCMMATGWQGSVPVSGTLKEELGSKAYHDGKKSLNSCRKCDKAMYICYWEPMTVFPAVNALTHALLGKTA
jgi:MoaA/NifB/PqqE/SkfB family radical SAM enzyme